jgi:hypothetical protein
VSPPDAQRPRGTQPGATTSAHNYAVTSNDKSEGSSGEQDIPGQMTLDDLPGPVGPAYRVGDSLTSIAAGQSLDPIKVSEQQADIVALIAQCARGLICSQVAARLNRDRGCIARRITDLHRRGLVRANGTRVAPSGRLQTVWVVTSSGQALAARHLARKVAS